MVRLFAIGLFLVGTISLVQAQDTYTIQTVTAAQEALIRLGYDVGEVDGQWGTKARMAMNDLRQRNGLPPASDFVGSSLELVHRLSPGATTLPHPGILVADPVERRAFLKRPENYMAPEEWCPAKVDDVGLISDLLKQPPVTAVDVRVGPKGYVSRDEDWSTPILQTLIGAHNACLVGRATTCLQINKLMSAWADADALRTDVKRTDSRAFDDTSWVANSLLRNFIFAYADARKLKSIDAAQDALILDWLKRRIDEYHYIVPSGNKYGDVNYTEASNHALANMMPAFVFGALVGDRSMMEGALASWRVAMGYIREDGSLPTETRRGARSLQYSNFQLAQLISTAEVARTQGIDLYAEMTAERSIPKIVEFLLDAYEDFDKVVGYAKDDSGSPGDYRIPYIIQMHFGWLPAYFVRFGADANIERMRTLKIDARICSPKALDDVKLSAGDRICESSDGKPVPFVRVLELGGGNVGEAANYFMGYSAQCAQGVTTSWPVMP